MSQAELHSVTPRHEPMRIAGRQVEGEAVLEVFDPYSGEVVGTIPRATPEHVREAFQIAADYQPKLTRYERQQILFRAAEILNDRRDAISDLITAECGICKKDSLYEVGRAYDVFTLAGAAGDPRRRRGLLLRHHARKARRGASSPPAIP